MVMSGIVDPRSPRHLAAAGTLLLERAVLDVLTAASEPLQPWAIARAAGIFSGTPSNAITVGILEKLEKDGLLQSQHVGGYRLWSVADAS